MEDGHSFIGQIGPSTVSRDGSDIHYQKYWIIRRERHYSAHGGALDQRIATIIISDVILVPLNKEDQ